MAAEHVRNKEDTPIAQIWKGTFFRVDGIPTFIKINKLESTLYSRCRGKTNFELHLPLPRYPTYLFGFNFAMIVDEAFTVAIPAQYLLPQIFIGGLT
jgi:hypothetical protein